MSSPYEYAAIARKSTILAQFANANGNFDVLITEVLQKINIRDNQFVCERNGHKIFIQRYEDINESENSDNSNLYFILIGSLNCQPNECFNILDKIQRSFLLRYSRVWQNCASYGLNKEFSGELSNFLNTSQLKLQQIKNNLNDAQDMMSDNMQKALLRNTQLEELNQTASEISQSSREFSRNSTQLNRQQLWKRLIFALLILFVLITFGLIIYFMAKD